MAQAALHFYFDPVCPFAWMTSTWVRTVAARRDYSVEWRFVSLRLLNAHVDYDATFPPEYEAGHTAGLRLLRRAARARATHGREAIGRLYAALGRHVFGSDRGAWRAGAHLDTREFVLPLLAEAGLPAARRFGVRAGEVGQGRTGTAAADAWRGEDAPPSPVVPVRRIR